MTDFTQRPIFGISIYGILLLSCLIEITKEFGWHAFDGIASHHGMAFFAFGNLMANWKEISAYFEKLRQ
jgi:hypothetical protein|tara:strand:- start:432 stop:638 length:207 start_codon:yes stop_codon:yes gene_type:complete